MRILFFSLFVVFVSEIAVAGGIKGYVYDSQTGFPLMDATVSLTDSGYSTLTGMNGFFRLKEIPGGDYMLKVSSVSYRTYTCRVSLSAGEELVLEIRLEPDRENVLEEVVVEGHLNNNTESHARFMEQRAAQIIHVVSGQSIRISPDLTVANLLQRVSGISVELDKGGDGKYTIMRGMDKRYNYLLVNGVKIPSPDERNRYIPLDIFPSQLLDRLEVYKTITPNMEADAMGGVVNLVMRDAPDSLQLYVNIASGYNDLFVSRDFTSFDNRSVYQKSPYETHPPRYNALPGDFSKGAVAFSNRRPMPDMLFDFSAGNRYLKRKLGVLLAGSVQNTYKGNNSLFFESGVVDTLKGVTLTTMKERNYSEREVRYALYGKIDYRLKGSNKIQWNNAFFNLTDFQVRDTRSTYLTTGGYDPVNGNAALQYDIRSRTTRKVIYNSNLQGEQYLLDDLKLNWSAVYSIANRDQPDRATIILDGEEKEFESVRTTVYNATRRWKRNTDRDISGYLNLTYYKPVATVPIDWMAGLMYRDRERVNFYNEYEFRPVDPYAKYGEDFDDYNGIQWIVENPRGSVGTSLNYHSFERLTAGYFQAKARLERVEITGGLRIEKTSQGYDLDFPIGENRPSGKQIYADVLPGLHVKYKPEEDIHLRLSYYRSLNRPGFFEIVPYTIVNEDYVEKGNPDLKHAVGDNVDIRFEKYIRPGGQVMLALFYKHIQNPIEYILAADSIRGQDIYYMPGNFGTARNYGLEIDLIKYFSRFGVKVNYTYTHSRITTGKSKRIRDEDGNLKTITVNETRRLYGQSAHIGNLALLFKNPKTGWNGQLAFQYTGDRIFSVSQFVGNDLWQKAFLRMDLSAEKKFKKGWSVFLKSQNLLNTPVIVYLKNKSIKNQQVPYQSLSAGTLIRQDYFYRTFYLGVHYSW